MFANLLASIIGTHKNKNAASTPHHIPFRVMFVSPFFELEVDAGNGWNTVHSQDANKLEDGSLVYPLLRFSSFSDATDYAIKTLGLTKMRERSAFGLYMAPPASYEKESKPRVIQQQNIVEGRTVGQAQIPEAVPSFVLHTPAPSAKVWAPREAVAA
ncbi:MAG: hypothetical protein ABWX90_03280 [Candidatus Saccharimonadales bacterium]